MLAEIRLCHRPVLARKCRGRVHVGRDPPMSQACSRPEISRARAFIGCVRGREGAHRSSSARLRCASTASTPVSSLSASSSSSRSASSTQCCTCLQTGRRRFHHPEYFLTGTDAVAEIPLRFYPFQLRC
eukprot:COSAG01_NODE_2105_length_8423_cov_6.483409_9_plen_129_part_00